MQFSGTDFGSPTKSLTASARRNIQVKLISGVRVTISKGQQESYDCRILFVLATMRFLPRDVPFDSLEEITGISIEKTGFSFIDLLSG